MTNKQRCSLSRFLSRSREEEPAGALTKQRSFLLAALFAAGICGSSHAALKEGDAAPVFHAPASLAGKRIEYRLADALSKGPVVVYFHPAAFTGGCNLQAREFAESLERFTAAGASIVGVSLDSLERLNEFSADPQSCAGKFAVASDAKGRIAKDFDIPLSATPAGRKNLRGQDIGHARAERTTFVIGTDGRVVATVGGVSPQENVARALAAVQALKRRSP